MKVSIIGGGGRVGADAAYALQLGGIVREIAIVDVDQDLAAGEALDLRHGSSLIANQKITSGGYEEVCGSDCILITAGLRRKPDESRLDLVNRNVKVFRQILDNIGQCALRPTTTMVVVSNPVDILTTIAIKSGILPEKQIVGLGTVLDTCRFRSLIADRYNVGAYDIKALILGEHGDSMVPIWSSATINGVPLKSIPGWSQETADEIFQATKKAGAEVIRMKGGAGRAVGVSIREVVEAIALDKGQTLPVSSMQSGKNGIADGICLSLPTVLGRDGVAEVLQPAVDESELEGLRKSAASLLDIYNQIQ